MRIILASASQRRIDYLNSLGLEFIIAPSQLNESKWVAKYKDPKILVKKLALAKAEEIAQKQKEEFLIIAADTIIVYKNKIIGKPKSRKEAASILKSLRENKHQVYTGLVLLDSKGNIKQIVDATDVYFKNFSTNDINEYLDTGVYLDRAGAYGIQDEKCEFVDRYEGSYSNILGLPMNKLLQFLPEFGIKVPKKGKKYEQ